MTNARIILRWLFAAGAVALIVLYFIFDPEQTRFAPRCVLNAVTGFECPGCGSQRMLHALLHGDLAAAWRYNAFLLCMIPVFAVMIFASCSRLKFPRLYAIVNSPAAIALIAAAIVGWTLARNLF